MNTQGQTMTCPHCGSQIEHHQYLMREDGSERCVHCYFQDTYLSGIVDAIETSYLVTLEAFVSAIDAREHEVGNHSLRVTRFALVVGHAYGINGRGLVDLYCGALLHDLGKIGVPDAILFKQGPLSEEEQAVMHRHPEIGYTIINRIGYFAHAAEIIRAHHEHFDGTGYPRGLKGAGIPEGARVFSAADALDALTVKRPYRNPLPFDEARKEIIKASSSIFDPSVIEAFTRAEGELREFVGKVVI